MALSVCPLDALIADTPTHAAAAAAALFSIVRKHQHSHTHTSTLDTRAHDRSQATAAIARARAAAQEDLRAAAASRAAAAADGARLEGLSDSLAADHETLAGMRAAVTAEAARLDALADGLAAERQVWQGAGVDGACGGDDLWFTTVCTLLDGVGESGYRTLWPAHEFELDAIAEETAADERKLRASEAELEAAWKQASTFSLPSRRSRSPSPSLPAVGLHHA
eukprot:354871-Chlamydomonas_euryale.AAC.3